MTGTFGQFFQTVMLYLEARYGYQAAAKFVGERAELVDIIYNDWQKVKDSGVSLNDAAIETAYNVDREA